jgi:hypothetical protein
MRIYTIREIENNRQKIGKALQITFASIVFSVQVIILPASSPYSSLLRLLSAKLEALTHTL